MHARSHVSIYSASQNETAAQDWASSARSNASLTDLPQTLDTPFGRTWNLPHCKTLNTEACGSSKTSIWWAPACCPTSMNFSSTQPTIRTNCSKAPPQLLVSQATSPFTPLLYLYQDSASSILNLLMSIRQIAYQKVQNPHGQCMSSRRILNCPLSREYLQGQFLASRI